MHPTESKSYQEAYRRYLRRGIPMDVSLKATHQSLPYYRWRTQRDERVRATHAANEGKIFAWARPPAAGHPGTEPGCRCHAEPVRVVMQGEQTQLSPVLDRLPKWTDEHFALYYLFGKGETVQLSTTGNLKDIIDYYAYKIGNSGIYKRVNQQILERALIKDNGDFIYNFRNSYDFEPLLYVIGDASVDGNFVGKIEKIEGNLWVVTGLVNYRFYDFFSDPFEIIEILVGALQGLHNIDFFGEPIVSVPVAREDIPDYILRNIDNLGNPYAIQGSWTTAFYGTISITD